MSRPSRRRALRAAAVTLLAAAAACLTVPAQAADPTYRCSEVSAANPQGSMWGEVLYGDLVADGECALLYSRITGDVTVPPGSSLTTTLTTVTGTLRTAGPVTAERLRVHGDLALEAPGTAQVSLTDSWVAGAASGSVGSLLLARATVMGPLEVTTVDAARLRTSVVGGTATVRGGRLLVHDSLVRGSLASTAATDALVCRSEVRGDLLLTGVQGWSRLGQERTEVCRTTVGGSVRLVDNPHSVVLGDLAVGGDLVCTGNTGPQGVVRTAGLTVAGASTGQCA